LHAPLCWRDLSRRNHHHRRRTVCKQVGVPCSHSSHIYMVALKHSHTWSNWGCIQEHMVLHLPCSVE
jgi:hypothetical protein